MFGYQVITEQPGNVLHKDHLFMQADSESGDRYLLGIKEGFSSLCELIPSPSTNAAHTARALLRWMRIRQQHLDTQNTEACPPIISLVSVRPTCPSAFQTSNHIAASYKSIPKYLSSATYLTLYSIFEQIVGPFVPLKVCANKSFSVVLLSRQLFSMFD